MNLNDLVCNNPVSSVCIQSLVRFNLKKKAIWSMLLKPTLARHNPEISPPILAEE